MILNEISTILIDNSNDYSLDKESHDELIETVNKCAIKLQSINNRRIPPLVPPKPAYLSNRSTKELEESSPEDLLNMKRMYDSPESMTNDFVNHDQSGHEKDVYIPIAPQSTLLKMYTKLIQKDSDFNPEKDLFGGFSSKSELLQKILDFIHIAASLTEIHHIRPFYLAFQLCLIDQELFRGILPSDFFNKNQSKSSIEPSTQFFNYLCRVVEHAALNPKTPNARAEILEYWIKTSKRLYQLRNFQSLKAITSALQSPPLYRLKITWSLVSKKKIKDLNALLEFCSEQDNYSQYRQWMKLNISKPMIPYFGIYIHDLTYISEMERKSNTPKKVTMEIMDQIKYFQSEPFYTYKYFVSLLTGNLYPKPRKPPIQPNAPFALQSLNSMSEESVGIFVSHCILTQKFYTEKGIDELSLIREPRKITSLVDRKKDSVELNLDSVHLTPSLGSYRKNIMNSIKSSMGRVRSKHDRSEKSSWPSLNDISNRQEKNSD